MNDDLMPDLLLAVEQQLASPQTRYVAKAFDRLVKLGLDQQEAKTQIAVCLGEEMEKILKTRKAFDETSYRENLDGLPFVDDEEDEEDGEDGEEEE